MALSASIILHLIIKQTKNACVKINFMLKLMQ